jgi:hypothetical protein
MSDGLKILIGALIGAIVILLFGSVFGGGMMGGMGTMMGGGLFYASICGSPRVRDPVAPLGARVFGHASRGSMEGCNARRISHMAISSSLVGLAHMPGGYFWRRTS